jgi:hypothetical protein
MIPTVSDTVRAHTRRFFLGDSAGWLIGPLPLVISMSAVLFVVPVRPTDPVGPLFFIAAVLVSVAAIDAGQREYQFGGPPRLILVAALTAGVIVSVVLVAVFAIRGALGSLLPLRFRDLVVVLAIFGTLVAYVVGWWKRDEAAIEAEVRAERARRGIDAVASGMAGSDPGRGLWAYVFLLALGGFGLLITAFAWAGYPGWPHVALGVGVYGPLAVFGLVGIVRARRASRR